VLVEEFARAGTEIVFLNRPIGQTPEDTLLLQLQGMFAEYAERAVMWSCFVLAQVRRVFRHYGAPHIHGYGLGLSWSERCGAGRAAWFAMLEPRREAMSASGALNRPRRSPGGSTASTASSFSDGSTRR
jgi:hypothetical protein